MAPSFDNKPKASPLGGGLTKEQVETFERDGYLVLPEALDPSTVASLLGETHSMLENFSLEGHPMTKFSTGEGKDAEHVGDEYFLSSSDKISFFFEEDAFDSAGKLQKPKSRAINKIGHYLHGLSPPFASLLKPSTSKYSPSKVARDLGFQDPRVLQSMVICKQPEIGGAVPPHQDSAFLYTDPPSAIGFWYALEDATTSNGCMSFWPGSHKWAGIDERFVRKSDSAGTEFVKNEGGLFPKGNGYGTPEVQGDYKIEETKAGTLVLIHGNIHHRSERNTSSIGRIIYTFHVIEGEEKYDGRNWLQPPEEGFTSI